MLKRIQLYSPPTAALSLHKKSALSLTVIIIALLSFLSSDLFAQELQSSYKRKFSGLNTKVSERLLEPDESPDMSNFQLDEVGAISERDVFGQYNTTAGILGNNPIHGLFKFYTTTEKYFVACAGTNTAPGTVGAFGTDISVTDNTVSAEQYWDAVEFGNNLYLFNSSVPMQIYDGTRALSTPAGYPTNNCKYAAVHKNRVWAGGAPDAPYRLFFSSLSNADDWTTTGGFADIPDESAHITGIKSWGKKLYVFTETNVYYVYGSTPNDFALVKTDSDVGCIAPRSIQVTEGGIFFLARTGVFRFNGARAYKVSDKIEPNINLISRSYIKDACGIWDGQSRYWLSYAERGSTINNKILIYDTLLKEWYQYDNLNISYFAKAHGPGDKGEIYGGSSKSDGIVWVLQAATGTETIVHDTVSEFESGTTFNTVVWDEEDDPEVRLMGLEWGEWGAFDSKDPDTKLLLHFNGTDGAVATSDSSLSAHVIGFSGNAQLDTAQKKFGESSILFDGAGDELHTANSTDWDMKTGDFTVELWVRFNSTAGDESLVAHGNAASYWGIIKTPADTLNFTTTGGNGRFSIPYVFSTGLWYHLAVVRHGADCLMFVNGESQSVTTIEAWGSLPEPIDALYISSLGGAALFFDGNIDELRITKGVARYLLDFDPHTQCSEGNLISTPLEINASGASTLGSISWAETLPTTGTDIQCTTRTGTTADTVYFNNWETWVSASSVSISTVTDYTAWFTSSMDYFYRSGGDTGSDGFVKTGTWDTLSLDTWGYETYDEVSPNYVEFSVSRGTASTNQMASTTFAGANISTYKWLGYWLWSPATGNSAVLRIGEVSGTTIGYCTASTAVPNTWEYHYWPISSYASADLDAIGYMEIEYLGEIQGALRLGEVTAYDFYDNEETITSTPNDFIQYRIIEGSIDGMRTPILYDLTLEYTPAAGSQEVLLSSYYKTKWLDFEKPMLNKEYLDLFLEAASTEATATVYIDYDVDHGAKSGTFTYTIATPNTVRKEKHFSGSTYGKTIQYNIRNEQKDAGVTIRALETRFREEGMN